MKDAKFASFVAHGQRVRSDSQGSGLWHAPRGNRLHKGIDLLVVPGREVFAPFDGRVVRFASPYADDASLGGVVIASDWCEVKLFYLQLVGLVPGSTFARGAVLGLAQDVSKKYGKGMKPHLHVQIGDDGAVDPSVFMEIED